MLFTSNVMPLSISFLDFSGSGRVQQRVKNEAFWTFFHLGTWQILEIDTLRIKKKIGGIKKSGGACGPLCPSRLLGRGRIMRDR